MERWLHSSENRKKGKETGADIAVGKNKIVGHANINSDFAIKFNKIVVGLGSSSPHDIIVLTANLHLSNELTTFFHFRCTMDHYKYRNENVKIYLRSQFYTI